MPFPWPPPLFNWVVTGDIGLACQAMVKKVFREKHVGPHIQNLPSRWSIGSTCSGTGNFELAMHAVAEAMNEALEEEDGFPFEVI